MLWYKAQDLQSWTEWGLQASCALLLWGDHLTLSLFSQLYKEIVPVSQTEDEESLWGSEAPLLAVWPSAHSLNSLGLFLRLKKGPTMACSFIHSMHIYWVAAFWQWTTPTKSLPFTRLALQWGINNSITKRQRMLADLWPGAKQGGASELLQEWERGRIFQ